MIRSTADQHYTRVAVLLHWTIALMILTNIGLGFASSWTAEEVRRYTLDVHKPLGVFILVLSVARLGWRLSHSPPPLPTVMPHWQRIVSHYTHILFYVLMIVLPVSGWLFSSAVPVRHSIRFFNLFDIPFLPLVQEIKVVGTLASLHITLAWVMTALVFLHLGAVAKHQFVDRDRLLSRMGI